MSTNMTKREPICGPTGIVTDETGAPTLRLPPAWGGLPLGLFAIPAQEQRGPECAVAPVLLLATQGSGRRWYRYSNGRTIELGTAPGMIELYAREYEYEGARWDGRSGQCIGITLYPHVIKQLVPDAPELNLKTAHEVFDSKLQWLVQELFDEALRGAPAGALYAQGLSCALIARLTEHYAAAGAAEPPSGYLSTHARRLVLEYIDAHLGEDLGLADLARVAGVSTWHFAAPLCAPLPPSSSDAAVDLVAASDRQDRAVLGVLKSIPLHAGVPRAHRHDTGCCAQRLNQGLRPIADGFTSQPEQATDRRSLRMP
ncbi:hypothetical protein ACVBEH_05255 [Roseateles sp. GG27B]